MKRHRQNTRRMLDARLDTIGDAIGGLPHRGWVRTMRDALGMSSYALARRMNLSPTRVRQLENAELEGSIRLATLGRAAEALNCRLIYVFLPNEPLEDLVLRQAYKRAAEQLCVWGPEHPLAGDPNLVARDRIDELEDLAMDFVDHRDLWR